MNIIECIKSRRSVRRFTDEKLEYDKIKELIDVGICAPTAQMRQPWGFVVIQGKDKLKEISDKIKVDSLKKLEKLPHFQKYEDWFKDPEYNVFYESENLLVIYGDSECHWYKEDCCCLAENIILAAFDQNIGSCWIGFAENYLETDEFKEKYDIPKQYKVVSSLILGYMEKLPKPPTRKEPIIFSEVK